MKHTAKAQGCDLMHKFSNEEKKSCHDNKKLLIDCKKKIKYLLVMHVTTKKSKLRLEITRNVLGDSSMQNYRDVYFIDVFA